MDVMIKLTVPNCIYRFYNDASAHVAGSSPESIMADALCAYAGLLNEDMANTLKLLNAQNETSDGYSEMSRSR